MVYFVNQNATFDEKKHKHAILNNASVIMNCNHWIHASAGIMPSRFCSTNLRVARVCILKVEMHFFHKASP